ncbi:hypothetical protein CDCA_CDCA20G4800 [Cyanidium caldarium]|uniref:AB hydrolase-1 domain-containing protein n=1 Tax=Cyanidium caldarium TaxID=2771 RepID=A0AAV9J2H8_CYACA|nr:hypothetical protein CDCA_CDCA20G4800 [Cyanidium caldarium]
MPTVSVDGLERGVSIAVNPTVTLRGWLYQPPGAAASERGVVLTHPHPKLGGDGHHNNVVAALAQALAGGDTFPCTVLTFNSRGHGGSSGVSTWRGLAEREDVLGVARWMHARLGAQSRVAVVGYSFGAAVCGSAVGQLCVLAGGAPAWLAAYVSISYPVGFVSRLLLGQHIEPTTKITLPKLFVYGGRDQFSSAASLEHLFARLPEPKDKVVFSEGDHFWVGAEDTLSNAVAMWLRSCWMRQTA